MKYMQGYDIEYDYTFQMELSDDVVERMSPNPQCVSDNPWPDLPIASRFKSLRHPGNSKVEHG